MDSDCKGVEVGELDNMGECWNHKVKINNNMTSFIAVVRAYKTL